MGSRGPLPKEEGKRQNRRARTNLKLIEQHDPSAVIVPLPPEGLSDTQVEAWSEFWHSELSQLVKVTDLSSVRRLFNYYQQHEDLTAIFQRGRMVAGSQGQPRLNPALDGLMKLETAILRLENELGLTPSARLRLGITFADATNSLQALSERFASLDFEEHDDLWADADEG
jgi:P27 family predicted phage terminase small subunit